MDQRPQLSPQAIAAVGGPPAQSPLMAGSQGPIGPPAIDRDWSTNPESYQQQSTSAPPAAAPEKPAPFKAAPDAEQERAQKIQRLEMAKNFQKYGDQLGRSLAGLAGHQAPSAFGETDTSGIDQEIAETKDILNPGEREMMKAAFGIDIPNATSWTRFAKIAPAMSEVVRQRSQVQEAALNRTSREKIAGMASEDRAAGLDMREKIAGMASEDRATGLGLRERSLDMREERMNRLDPAEMKTLDSLNTSTRLVDSIIADKPKFETGPLEGRLLTTKGLVGIADPEKQGFKQRVNTQLVEALHALAGSAMTKQEVALILPTLPTMNDANADFMEKAKNIKTMLEQKKASFLQARGTMGKNVGEFQGAGTAAGGGKIRFQIEIGGQTFTKESPSMDQINVFKRDHPDAKVTVLQ